MFEHSSVSLSDTAQARALDRSTISAIHFCGRISVKGRHFLVKREPTGYSVLPQCARGAPPHLPELDQQARELKQALDERLTVIPRCEVLRAEIRSRLEVAGSGRLEAFIASLSAAQGELVQRIVEGREVSPHELPRLVGLQQLLERQAIPAAPGQDAWRSQPGIFARALHALVSLLRSFRSNGTVHNHLRLMLGIENASPAPRACTLSRRDLRRLIADEARRNGGDGARPVALAKALDAAGHPPCLRGMDLSWLPPLDLEGMTFEHCEFYWQNANSSVLKDVVFRTCWLAGSAFTNAQLDNCQFLECDLDACKFFGARLNGVVFGLSRITQSSFEHAQLRDTVFHHAVLSGTTFLEAEVENCAMRACRLDNALLFDAAHAIDVDTVSGNSATRSVPIVSVPVLDGKGISVPKAFVKLREVGETLPVLVSAESPWIPQDAVSREMEALLAELAAESARERAAGRTPAPIARQLPSWVRQHGERFPSVAAIVRKADRIVSSVDAILLPGGADLPPALYEAEPDPRTQWSGDYRRAILELALVDASRTRGVPLMGVCRGMQVTTIYYGAQLVQHVDGHTGVQLLRRKPAPHEGLLGMRDPLFRSAVAHHQAIPVSTPPSPELEVVVVHGDLIKAAEPSAGAAAPAVLLQFHPEFLNTDTGGSASESLLDIGLPAMMSSSNDRFWKILGDSARAYRAKQAVLESVRRPSARASAALPPSQAHADI